VLLCNVDPQPGLDILAIFPVHACVSFALRQWQRCVLSVQTLTAPRLPYTWETMCSMRPVMARVTARRARARMADVVVHHVRVLGPVAARRAVIVPL
jgi:hypothetical protein